MRIKQGEDGGLTHQFGTREAAECSFYSWMVWNVWLLGNYFVFSTSIRSCFMKMILIDSKA